jgi:hypothetical protein
MHLGQSQRERLAVLTHFTFRWASVRHNHQE